MKGPSVLDYIKKQEYFGWLDLGLAKPGGSLLRTYQEAYLLSRLSALEGKRILEIGVGNSRVAEICAQRNEVWAVAKLEGIPVDGTSPAAGVRRAAGRIGAYERDLPAGYFDFVFSFSFIEHIPRLKYFDVVQDIARILAPGGQSLHTVDIYVGDDGDRSDFLKYQQERLDLYLETQMLSRDKLDWREAPAASREPVFRSSYVSTGDDIIYGWNRNFPGNAAHRLTTSSCSLKMEMVRTSVAASQAGGG